MWRALQYPQTRLSTRGKALPLKAGHAVFREQPAAVIDAVLDMIAEIMNCTPDSTALDAAKVLGGYL